MFNRLKYQATLLIGALMAFAYSALAPCSSGACQMGPMSIIGVFLLLFAVGKRRFPVPLTLLIVMLLLRSCQGPLPGILILPGVG